MKTDYIEIQNPGKTTIFATLPLDSHGCIASSDAVKETTKALKKAFPGSNIVVTAQPIQTLTMVHGAVAKPEVL